MRRFAGTTRALMERLMYFTDDWQEEYRLRRMADAWINARSAVVQLFTDALCRFVGKDGRPIPQEHADEDSMLAIVTCQRTFPLAKTSKDAWMLAYHFLRQEGSIR